MVNMITKQDMYLHSNEQTSFLPADKRLSFDSVPCQASAAWNTCQFLWTHPKKVKLQQQKRTQKQQMNATIKGFCRHKDGRDGTEMKGTTFLEKEVEMHDVAL